jgi:hypothetical protein
LAVDRGIAERHPVKVGRDEVVFMQPEPAATDPHLLLTPAPGDVGPCDSIRTRCGRLPTAAELQGASMGVSDQVTTLKGDYRVGDGY